MYNWFQPILLSILLSLAMPGWAASTCYKFYLNSWLGESIAPLESVKHGQDHANARNATHVLLTDKIPASQFPYVTMQRSPESLNPDQLFKIVQTVPEVAGLQISKVIIGSPDKSAKNGLVRLGYLPDGRPVIVKTLMTSRNETKSMNEAKGTYLLSLIGVGPKFHGVSQEGAMFHIVTDLIVGENYSVPKSPTLKVLGQMLEITNRLNAVGIHRLPDNELLFQTMRTKTDDILVIDPDSFYEGFLEGNPGFSQRDQSHERYDDYHDYHWRRTRNETPRSNGRPWFQVLSGAVLKADVETMRTFLELLHAKDKTLYDSVVSEIKDLVYTWNASVGEGVKELINSLK